MTEGIIVFMDNKAASLFVTSHTFWKHAVRHGQNRLQTLCSTTRCKRPYWSCCTSPDRSAAFSRRRPLAASHTLTPPPVRARLTCRWYLHMSALLTGLRAKIIPQYGPPAVTFTFYTCSKLADWQTTAEDYMCWLRTIKRKVQEPPDSREDTKPAATTAILHYRKDKEITY